MLRNWEFLLLEMWGHLALSVLLTALSCWFFWGRNNARTEKLKLAHTNAKLENANKELEATKGQLETAIQKQETLKNHLTKVQMKLSETNQKIAEERKKSNSKPSFSKMANSVRENGKTAAVGIFDRLSEHARRVLEKKE